MESVGYSEAVLPETPFLDSVHPDNRTSTKAETELLRQDASTTSFEKRYRCVDGLIDGYAGASLSTGQADFPTSSALMELRVRCSGYSIWELPLT